MIAEFLKIKNGDNLEACLGNFLDVLEKAEVPDEDQVGRLKSVLTGEYSELIHSLKLAEHSTFEEARKLLLEAAGYTQFAGRDRFPMTRCEKRC